MFTHLPYTELLIKKGALSEDTLKDIEKIELETGRNPEEILVEENFVKRRELLKAKSEFYGCDYVDLADMKIDALSVRLIPKSMCERYKLLCLNLAGNELEGLMVEPSDKFAKEYIRIRTGYGFSAKVGYWGDMKNAIQKAFSIPDAGSYKTSERPANRLTPGEPISGSAAKECEEREEQSVTLRQAFSGLKSDWEIQKLINEVSMDLGTYLDKRTLIPKILELGKQIFNVEGVSLILLQENQPYLYFKNVLGDKEQQMENMMIPLDEKSIAGWIAINGKPVLINDVKKDFRHSKVVDEATEFVTRSILGVPVKYGKTVLGVLEAVNKKDGEFVPGELEYMKILASHAAIALKNAAIYDKLRNFAVETVELLIDFLDYIEEDLKGHMVEVARITASIGERLGLEETELENLCQASLLHDIGILKIRDGEIDQHPVYGAEILQHIKLLESLIPYVLYHHERFDGTGYPYRLKGDEIPLGAQILSIAENFVEGFHTSSAKSREEYLDAFLVKFGHTFNPALKDPFAASINENAEAHSG